MVIDTERHHSRRFWRQPKLTREEALSSIEAAMARHLGNGVELVDVPLPTAPERPWLKYAGDLNGNPLFDAWQESIHEARRRRDLEDGIEYISDLP